jgi:ATP-dependent DNA ligase
LLKIRNQYSHETDEEFLPKQKRCMNPAYRPMLATLVDEPFDSKDWVFETKWDGIRLITASQERLGARMLGPARA